MLWPVDGGYSDVRWRVLLAFQCLPALIFLISIKLLQDSPRYLASVGLLDDAQNVLEHIRGGSGPELESKFMEISTVAKKSHRNSPLQFVGILSRRGGRLGSHLD